MVAADESSPLPTRERQRQDTRERILRVALAEIAEVGFSQARIEHIARKAGVTRPTIYAHFPTKQHFLHELETRTQIGALEVIRERLSGVSETDLVHRLVDAIFDLVAGANPVLLREVFALTVREPAKADWIGNPLFGFLTDRFADAQARGEISSTPKAAELTRIVMTALFGFLVVEAEPAADRRRAAHRTVDLIVRGAAS
ncbi:MAG: TetR/AcrR family transcriptional regulator [Deltaproteobacteria bacterium]|jgi:AcrR family transcriptional regulator|nr:TetR/AcrR family transcriptional regulator [Deltaproteobacteria bacterium]MBW2384714.1 TetR/AcrR family transcriptional regulator [Deltaproteobacteria bacterium]MBW2695956.1 TetR/AcrR family transcriptional regulator [Deltaproteobacteria bacterium]